ncbi:Ionotropic receptor 10a [Carabus blaptoides fortunei]
MSDLYLIIILAFVISFGKTEIPDPTTQILHNSCNLQDKDFWRAYTWNFKNSSQVTMIKLITNYSKPLVEEFVTEMLHSQIKKQIGKLSIFITAYKLTYMVTPRLSKTYPHKICNRSEPDEDDEAEKVNNVPPRKQQRTEEPSTLKKRLRTFSGDKNYAFQIIVWDVEDLLAFVAKKFKKLFPNPRGIYMVTFISSQNVPFYMWQNALRWIWLDFGVLNIVFHLPCSCKRTNLYMLDPFARNGTSWGMVRVFNIDDAEANDEHYRNTLHNLNGYRLRVSIFNRTPTNMPYVPPNLQDNRLYKNLTYSKGYVGLDGLMMGTLAERINFNPLIYTDETDYGFAFNGTYYGSFGLVAYRKVDISFNTRFVDGFGSEVVEYLTPVINDKFCLVVPKASRIPQALSLFRCFDLNSWLLILFTYIVASMYWYAVQRADFTRSHVNRTKNIVDTFLDIFCLFISVPIRLASTTNHRMFLFVCMVFNIIIIGSFQGQLITSFSKHSYYSDIDTLEEFEKSGLLIETPTNATVNIFDVDNTTLMRQLTKRVVVGNRENLIKIIVEGDKIAMFERRADALLRINIYDGEDKVHIVSECPRSLYFTYIVPRGSPYTHVFNILITIIRESGLVNKWSKDITYSLVLTARMNRTPVYFNNKFTLDNLQIPFYFLIIGHVIGILVFIGELYSAKRVEKSVLKII